MDRSWMKADRLGPVYDVKYDDFSRPRQFINKKDVYLSPLIEDLKLLWDKGVDDAYSGERFKMRAMLFSTINDFPAYGNLAGYSLKFGKKTVYLGHHKFLKPNHHYRRLHKAFNKEQEFEIAPKPLTGDEVYQREEHLSVVFGKNKDGTIERNIWKKRSTVSLLPCTSLRKGPGSYHENVQPTLSIFNKCGRPSGKLQDYWVLDKERESAHMHVLINCDEVKPYLELFMQYHRINEEDASGLIHEQFPSWLKEYVNDKRNGTSIPYVKALALGPNPKATSWHIYFLNGYKFHTEERSRGKKTTNCGVHVKGITNGGEDNFYDIIQCILQLEYHGSSNNISLFYYAGFNPTNNSGTRVDKEYNIVDIKMNK
ncbi:uncharacterized protein LOC131624571 [Vicia villosa]|uniref:uncharacterized protein LOC131624571 n=1 Tax=Vicia villosa TaxID=3911 RepID=UPI00273B6CE4|nr:uncharacterized protein LOC131624571 [Vicia villosa]